MVLSGRDAEGKGIGVWEREILFLGGGRHGSVWFVWIEFATYFEGEVISTCSAI